MARRNQQRTRNPRAPEPRPVTSAAKRHQTPTRSSTKQIQGTYRKIGTVNKSTLSTELTISEPIERGGPNKAVKTATATTPVTRKKCKGRPKSNKSKGGGSRSFVKWCS
jgi:hypothetical protein